jgi:diguanylate cyclase (GGDEF)-like protein
MSRPAALIERRHGASPQAPQRARVVAHAADPANQPTAPSHAAFVAPARFFERLQAATIEMRPALALLVIDVDGFHDVNEIYGYAAGDRLLESVGQRLALQLRVEDLVTRIGADEFAVYASEVADPGQAALIARRLLAGLRRPFMLSGRPCALTARAGIALAPEHGRDPRALMRAARGAARHAKQADLDVALVPSRAHALAAEHDALVGRELRAGMLRGEFKVHYQPILNFACGRVDTVEALVRWRHPTRGLLAPDEFLPVAERCGVARAIGARVLDCACANLRGWRAAGYTELRVAVNLSARDFGQPDFVDTVAATLARHALPASALELELTEHELLADAGALEQAAELARRGVALSIDDFGTKYSSLGCLHRLPVRAIKVDRSFVRDVGRSPASDSIVSALIGIAGKMGLRLIAEGVEEMRQLHELRRRGCHVMQGFLFSPPLPATAVDGYLAKAARRGAH